MKNKCHCYGGFDCEVCNPDKYEEQRKNETPWTEPDQQLSGRLEQELNASKAEVEELQQQTRNCMEIIDDDAKEKSELKAEVERLTAMVMEAARLGDSRASNFKDRAEKAESLLTQIQAFTEALNPKIK